MYRCKNWFCARSNNNNYVDVALNEPGATPAPAPALAATGTGTGTAHSSSNSNNNSNSNSINRARNKTNSHQQAHATPTDEPQQSAGAAHVVTFLEDTAGGSNGGVTSSRIVTTAELHQAHMLEHHSNLDAIEQADDFIYGPGAGLSLCDDSLPSAKNCYRLVMLG